MLTLSVIIGWSSFTPNSVAFSKSHLKLLVFINEKYKLGPFVNSCFLINFLPLGPIINIQKLRHF